MINVSAKQLRFKKVGSEVRVWGSDKGKKDYYILKLVKKQSYKQAHNRDMATKSKNEIK